MQALTPERIIALLDMQPHPEGGHFVETFRDNAHAPGSRGHATAIYFLLQTGEVSAWHRVRDAAEIWHWHAGSPLLLTVTGPDGGPRSEMRLGADLAGGERPQGVVPAAHWQTARSLGAWTLVGCTVAPGFEFAAFELARDGWEPPL